MRAKDFVCRKLMVIGTAASVPALAELLPERRSLAHGPLCPGTNSGPPEAAQALRSPAEARRRAEDRRDRLAGCPRRRNRVRAGAGRLLGDHDAAVARAAALALGDIAALPKPPRR